MTKRDKLILTNRLYVSYSRRIDSKRSILGRHADTLTDDQKERIQQEIKSLQDRMVQIEAENA